ncbi:GntR family transcriptional regulator PhnF [Nocardioides hungaricus]
MNQQSYPRRHASARRPDRTGGGPLWEQVRADVTRRLRRGEFREGFPSEATLVAEYKVSRQTVRQALRSLREAGLISAGRGRASRVAEKEISQQQGALYSLFASVERAGYRQRSEVRRLDARADGTVATRLGLEESSPLVYLERVRLADEVPLAMDRVWLPARLAAPLLDADFTRTSLYAELDRLCGVRLTGGSEQVRAAVPTVAERATLDIDERTAVLAIDRLGNLRGELVEWRQTLVRGDRFAFVTDLTSPDRTTVTVLAGGRPR